MADLPQENRRGFKLARAYCSSCSTPLFQYAYISSAVGSLTGRTSRNPSHCASVMYQMLFGNCGSCCFHDASEATRAEQRRAVGGSFQEPPRTACGYGAVAFTHGFFAGAAVYGAYASSVHSMTLPSMS